MIGLSVLIGNWHNIRWHVMIVGLLVLTLNWHCDSWHGMIVQLIVQCLLTCHVHYASYLSIFTVYNLHVAFTKYWIHQPYNIGKMSKMLNYNWGLAHTIRYVYNHKFMIFVRWNVMWCVKYTSLACNAA
jgi:hypothetical protein